MTDTEARRAAERVLLAHTPQMTGLTSFFYGNSQRPGLLQLPYAWVPIRAGKIAYGRGGPHAHARQNCIDQALERPKKDWTHLLFMDSDQLFSVQTIPVVGSYPSGVDIAGGLYFTRDAERPRPVAYRWADESRQSMKHAPDEEVCAWLAKPGLYEVDVVGTGAMAISRRLLESWEGPVFQHQADDVGFCRDAQDRGYKVYCDSRRPAWHLDEVDVGPQWFLSYLRRHGAA